MYSLVLEEEHNGSEDADRDESVQGERSEHYRGEEDGEIHVRILRRMRMRMGMRRRRRRRMRSRTCAT